MKSGQESVGLTEAVVCVDQSRAKVERKTAGMYRRRMALIPRYNWDYGLSDFLKAAKAVVMDESCPQEKVGRVFGREAVFTTSGRASLYAILKSLDLRDGSHVGVPLFCCPVVFDAIRRANLVPKFLDIDLDNYNLSPLDLERKKDTLSAVVVVHMFGHPADMDSISVLCKSIPVIEDCAQSLFSRYRGSYTGFQSTASFFSFRSGKYISAGEGSAIFCGEPLLRESIRGLVEKFAQRSLSQELAHCAATYVKSTFYHRPWYGILGHPLGRLLDKRLNVTSKTGFSEIKISKGDLHILNDRIGSFVNKVNRQRENALYLKSEIKLQNVILPAERDGCSSNYYQFAIRFDTSSQRDFVADYLWRRGIDSAKYLSDVADVAREVYDYQGGCPNSEVCARTILVIPHYYSLARRDLHYLVGTLNETDQYLRMTAKS